MVTRSNIDHYVVDYQKGQAELGKRKDRQRQEVIDRGYRAATFLVKELDGIVKSLAKSNPRFKFHYDDMVQIGRISLLGAAGRYNFGKMTFRNYAYMFVKWEMIRKVRELSLVHVPHGTQLNDLRLSSLNVSLPDRNRDHADNDGVEINTMDRPDDIKNLEEVAEKFFVERLISRASFSRKELMIIKRRFGLGGHPAATLNEVGEVLNISKERVRQIETQAIRKMRVSLGLETEAEAARLKDTSTMKGNTRYGVQQWRGGGSSVR